VQVSVADTTRSHSPTALLSNRFHQNGPLAGICPYVVTSSSIVDIAPVPLVVSPSLPVAVDLSVCHADDAPLNLSVSTAAADQCLFQLVSDATAQPASSACLHHHQQQSDGRQCDGGLTEVGLGMNQPPPAHCHVSGRGVLDSKLSTDALTRLQTQWTVSCHDNRFTDASTSGATSTGCTPGVSADAALMSLDVLSVAAALRSEMLDRRLAVPAAADAVTLPSSLVTCQVRRCSK